MGYSSQDLLVNPKVKFFYYNEYKLRRRQSTAMAIRQFKNYVNSAGKDIVVFLIVISGDSDDFWYPVYYH